MSLVGPRPETPEIVAMYTEEQRNVLAVKPGITGKVQLDSRDEAEMIPVGVKADEYYVQHLMECKLRVDLDYLQNRTFLTDIQILAGTAALVLRSLVSR
jgi:lipopolysaccharide/colanic/teichoic acid biosynthesis glycosyltransferase